jgi:hypothetical protein
MIKREFCFTAVVCLTTISSSIVLGGGALVVPNDYSKDINVPDQEVVIWWDGVTETMVLSTKFQVEELTNLGWIIPIPSTEKTEVELGDEKIFSDMEDYFRSYGTARERTEFDSIRVIETKELDFFHIVILKVSHVEALYGWLEENNFRVDEKVKSVFSFYTNADCYFIAVKFDFFNKYHADLKDTEKYIEFYKKMVSLKKGLHLPLKISFKPEVPFFPMKISNLNTGKLNLTAYVIAKDRLIDTSDILRVSEYKELNQVVKTYLNKYFDMKDMKYVTKLIFKEQPSSFHDDVYFAQMDSPEELDTKNNEVSPLERHIDWANRISKRDNYILFPDMNEALAEVNKSFTYKGMHIHPDLVNEFEVWLSDNCPPITVSVDILAARRSGNEYGSKIEFRGDTLFSYNEKRYGRGFNGRGYYYYTHLGKMANGIHVLQTGSGGGGTGVFKYLYFVRFSTDKAYNSDGTIYERLLMTVIRRFLLGDRDDGNVEVLPDKVIVSPSRYRKETTVLTFD